MLQLWRRAWILSTWRRETVDPSPSLAVKVFREARLGHYPVHQESGCCN